MQIFKVCICPLEQTAEIFSPLHRRPCSGWKRRWNILPTSHSNPTERHNINVILVNLNFKVGRVYKVIGECGLGVRNE